MQRSKPSSCIGCACSGHGNDFSQVEGTGSSGVLLVGEASGEHEQRDQLPFRPYAPAGGVLERVLRRMGLDRKMMAITNCVRCRPRHNFLENAPWEYSALRQCRPNLDAVIAQYQPRCIVALGSVALRELTGLAGEKLGVTYLAGYVLPQLRYAVDGQTSFPAAIPVIANFHPSYLRRGKASYQGVFARILQRALNIASGKDRGYLWNVDPALESTWGGLQYQVHPSLDEARAFRNLVRDNPNLTIAQDIETPESASMDEDAREGFRDTQIRQIQFSIRKGQGIALPWEEPFRSIAVEILHSRNIKYGHNWDNYDHKVLRAAALREGWTYAPSVRVYDTLDMFHHWQPDLPAHLQFACSFINAPFPWKHLHTIEHEPFYGCCDTDQTLQLGDFLVQKLKADGIWGDATVGYHGQLYEVRPVLAAMEDRGVPIDDAARLRLGEKFDIAQREMGQELMAKFPEEAKKVEPYKANRKGVMNLPPELKKLPESEWCSLHQEPDKWKCKCGRENKMDSEYCGKDGCNLWREEGRVKAGKWYRYGIRRVQEATIGYDGEPVTVYVDRWCYIHEFNPNSGKQLIEYMKVKGHPVPKDKHREDDEGNNPETTAAKELQRLANKTGDTFYLKVIEYRGLGKMKGTYIEGFVPQEDGCVHTTFTFDTGIGQLSSRNPNIQNFPKLKPTLELAKEMRSMIAAKPGHVISEWDFKSCHVITLGFLAEDLNYMRLGRLDIHSCVAGHFLNLWDAREIFKESDEDLLARFKWLKKNPEWKRVRDDQAKHGILGIGNGLKAKGLYERYMEQFPPRICPRCAGVRMVQGVRGMKQCPECKATGMQSGMRIAEQVLEIAQQLFPKVFEWQARIQKLAHEQQYLKTQFGHIRRFYEVFRWDAKRCAWGHGDQAEEAIAFWLANIAFGHIREKLKELYRSGLDKKYGLFNNVHDSAMFMFPEELSADHVREIYPLLTSPSKILVHPTIAPNGLSIGVEGAYGKNWAEMKEIKVEDYNVKPMEVEDSGVPILGKGEQVSRVGDTR